LKLLNRLLWVAWGSRVVRLHLQRLACFNSAKRIATVLGNWEVGPGHLVDLDKLVHLVFVKGSYLHVATVHSLFELRLSLVLNHSLGSTHIWFGSGLDLAIKVLNLGVAEHKLVVVDSLKVLDFLGLLACVVGELLVDYNANLLFLVKLKIIGLVLSVLTLAIFWNLHLELRKDLQVRWAVDQLLLLHSLVECLLLRLLLRAVDRSSKFQFIRDHYKLLGLLLPILIHKII
jgi:hypothetical protein